MSCNHGEKCVNTSLARGRIEFRHFSFLWLFLVAVLWGLRALGDSQHRGQRLFLRIVNPNSRFAYYGWFNFYLHTKDDASVGLPNDACHSSDLQSVMWFVVPRKFGIRKGDLWANSTLAKLGEYSTRYHQTWRKRSVGPW